VIRSVDVIGILFLLGVPIAYLIVLARSLIRKDWRGVGLSLVFAAIAAIGDYWSITQSTSSTAGIGILLIPLLGALAGFLGLGFSRYRTSADQDQRVGAWLALGSALVLFGFILTQGQTASSNKRRRDAEQTKLLEEISRDRNLIAAGLKENPGRERAWMDSAIRANINDRSFLLAALPRDSISPDILDSLANSRDLGIALEAVRNPNTRGETLERVYRTQSYPDYFFQALAAHPHTPPNVMRELYARPATITGLDIWFAGNPATPREILDKFSRTSTDRSVITSLLGNPALDCALLGQVGVNLMKVQHLDADDGNVMRVSELLPTVCPQKAPL
jgi:hypothetical protein